MQNVQRIVLVDFGAQYTQLIARRVREANVFCEVVSYLTPLSEILDKKPVGIILSGGPASVLDADAPHIDPAIYEQGIPTQRSFSWSFLNSYSEAAIFSAIVAITVFI